MLKEGKRATPTWLMSVDIVVVEIARKTDEKWGAFIFSPGYSATMMSTDVSQVGVTLFFLFNIFYHFTFSGFPFILIKSGYIRQHRK